MTLRILVDKVASWAYREGAVVDEAGRQVLAAAKGFLSFIFWVFGMTMQQKEVQRTLWRSSPYGRNRIQHDSMTDKGTGR